MRDLRSPWRDSPHEPASPRSCGRSKRCARPSRTLRRDGLRIGLVPTMGALHEGHWSWSGRPRRVDRAVVSIFVNPRQFAPTEDFARYPRREADDLAMLGHGRGDLVFAPPVEAMYPDGFRHYRPVAGAPRPLRALPPRPFPGHGHGRRQASPPVPARRRLVRREGLAAAPGRAADGARPGHAGGDRGVPTVREADGLALSSRNQYLSPGERERAVRPARPSAKRRPASPPPGRSRRSWARPGHGSRRPASGRSTMSTSSTPGPWSRSARWMADPLRLAAAAWLGRTRLIDNWSVPPAA